MVIKRWDWSIDGLKDWCYYLIMNTRGFYIKKSIGFAVACAFLVAGFFVLNKSTQEESLMTAENNDYKNTSYMIDGKLVRLTDGYNESEVFPGSVLKTVTRYFGNELLVDLDGDGDDDITFILTQETGGSGTFYYAVAAINTESGYVGSDGYLLGDRIAPQSTNVSQNPRHKNVVVFNYVERARDEPMSAPPSVGKSVHLKLVPETVRWGIVEPDFVGESVL